MLFSTLYISDQVAQPLASTSSGKVPHNGQELIQMDVERAKRYFNLGIDLMVDTSQNNSFVLSDRNSRLLILSVSQLCFSSPPCFTVAEQWVKFFKNFAPPFSPWRDRGEVCPISQLTSNSTVLCLLCQLLCTLFFLGYKDATSFFKD